MDSIEGLVAEIAEEDADVERALMREFVHGGELFPKTPKGPNLVERAFARHSEIMQLRREFAEHYRAMQLGLLNYSRRLYEAGRTDDFLVPPHLAETARRQLLEEALAEEAGAA